MLILLTSQSQHLFLEQWCPAERRDGKTIPAVLTCLQMECDTCLNSIQLYKEICALVPFKQMPEIYACRLPKEPKIEIVTIGDSCLTQFTQYSVSSFPSYEMHSISNVEYWKPMLPFPSSTVLFFLWVCMWMLFHFPVYPLRFFKIFLLVCFLCNHLIDCTMYLMRFSQHFKDYGFWM